MKKISKYSFKKLVKKKIEEEAFRKLLERKEKHKKMEHVQYKMFELQEYLKQSHITPNQARTIFKFRIRMENFSENFKGGKPTKPCPICNASKDMQSHSFECTAILKNLKISGNYKDIFQETISRDLARTLENIVKFREEYL